MEVGNQIDPNRVDFIISLHFESPRCVDAYTYYALWQPLEFYADFGYEVSTDKFSTHNDLISCHSDFADLHALNMFHGLGRNVPTPLLTLFHNLPEPYLEPRIGEESNAFYVGINWERIGRPKGRFHDVLTKLDQRGLIRIYGPEEIHGVAPWEGFQTYAGELPFDGASVAAAINDCGICLALSSKPHQNTGIMSNRLFEGLAGGAAVIANPNPLIDKYFKDIVYLVDDSRGESYLEQKIAACIREIRSDPDAARARVLEGQRILRERCSLEGSLQTLFDQTPARKSQYYQNFPKATAVSVILVIEHSSLDFVARKLDEIARQRFCVIDLHLVVSLQMTEKIDRQLSGAIGSLTVHGFNFAAVPAQFEGIERPPVAIGGVIAEILNTIEAPYFAILRQNDMIMSDHFASLCHALNDLSGAGGAVSGSLLRGFDPHGREKRKLDELRIDRPDRLLLVEGNVAPGRALFRSALYKPEHDTLLRLLDGCEHLLFLLAAMIDAPLAQSNYATHLCDEGAPVSLRKPPLTVDLQRQFIRDLYMSNPKWLDRTGLRPVVHALPPGADPSAPGRWMTVHTHQSEISRLEPNKQVPIKLGEAGMDYLVSGFSFGEENGVWLASPRGTIAFRLPLHVGTAIDSYRLVLRMLGRRSSQTGRMQHCTFIINNLAVAYQAIPDFVAPIAIHIPLNVLRGTSDMILEIIPDHAEIVHDAAGRVTDSRKLSVLLTAIAVEQNDVESIPSLAPNVYHALVEGEPAIRTLFAGFYPPERLGTWMCGLSGDIRLRVKGAISEPVLCLRLSARKSNHIDTPQTVRVSVNDGDAQELLVGEGASTFSIALPALDRDATMRISLRAAHAEPVLDSSGEIIDPRLLGFCLFEISVFEKSALQPPKAKSTSFQRLLGGLRKNSKGLSV